MKLYIVDAFTESAFKGNPAAVCLMDRKLPERVLQNIAMEMNLSETAFLWLQSNSFQLRWFTPTVEVSLCGHATLASAHILWEERIIPMESTARFETMSGELLAGKKGDWIEMDFPARIVEPFGDNSFAHLLGLTPLFLGRFTSPKGDLYFLELQDETTVKDLKMDFQTLLKSNAAALIITAKAKDKDYDFVSRFFAPAMGINEDPVTGSAHCSLAPYWTEKLGKADLVGLQLSQRTGIVRCKWLDDRVFLMGKAKKFLTGKIDV